MLLFIVRPMDRYVSILASTLLFALVLAIIDLDYYSDILVKRIGSVLLI